MHIRALILAALLLTSAPYSRSEENNVIRHVVGQAQRFYLLQQSTSSDDYGANEQRSGIFPSTTIIQGAGRLLTTVLSTGKTASCSGIALNSRYFLTAAHCVCNVAGLHAEGASDCQSHFADLKLSVFFPQIGIVDIVDTPSVHPAYRSPTTIVSREYGNVADIAVLKLVDEIPVGDVNIGYGIGKYMVTGTGFMYFTIGDYAAALGFPIGTAVHDGVFHHWRLVDAFSDKAACGTYHSADTMCSLYMNLPVESGPLQYATVCSGDSGSALLQRTADGALTVAAVTSYFSPPNEFDQCLADINQRNHYTLLARYQVWLSQYESSRDVKEPIQECVSGLFRAGTVELLGYQGVITATAFSARSDERPNISVSADETACRHEASFGVLFCRIVKRSYVNIKIGSGFAQLTICGG